MKLAVKLAATRFNIAIIVLLISLNSYAEKKSDKKIPTPVPTPAPTAPPTSAGSNLSLGEAVDLALRQNPSMLEAREKVHQAETQLPLARSYLFPNISATAAINENKSAASSSSVLFGGSPYNQYAATIKATQTVFQIGSISAIQSVDKDRQITQLSADISNRDLIGNVIKSYYKVILFARQMETLNRQKAIEKESLDVATRRERTGRGQLLDVLQAKTQLSLLEGQISTAQNSLQTAVAVLASYVGESAQVVYNVKNKLEAPDLKSLDTTVNVKNYKIPEIEREILLIGQADDLKNVNLGQNLPSLQLIGSYSWNSYTSSSLFDSANNSWGVGLQLTIPLFSGLSVLYQQEAYTSLKYQYEFEKKNQEALAQLYQITNRKNLESALDSIRTGVDALKLAIQSSEEAKKNFRLATIDFLVFLNVQNSYVQAEQALNVNKYNYIAAMADYYASMGQDMSHLVTILEVSNK